MRTPAPIVRQQTCPYTASSAAGLERISFRAFGQPDHGTLRKRHRWLQRFCHNRSIVTFYAVELSLRQPAARCLPHPTTILKALHKIASAGAGKGGRPPVLHFGNR